MGDNVKDINDNEIRIFISSTFKDMQKEREYLIKKVFPELRHICRQRGGEFTEVDLRWGITEEDAKKGKVVQVCLQEIDRCRPYFIGILGKRYGWVPGPKDISIDNRLEDKYKSIIKEGIAKGLSVTEMEILHGVLNNPEMAGKAFFYFVERSDRDNQEYFDEDEKNSIKLEDLKDRIRESGLPLREGIKDIAELGKAVKEDLESVLDERFLNEKKLSPLEKRRIAHNSFASTRIIGYEENPDNLKPLYKHVESENQPLIIYGDSGIGKSALLAYWSKRYREEHPEAFIIEHYIGASDNSSNHLEIIRRIMGEIKERYNLSDEIPADPEQIQMDFPLWLAMVQKEKLILIIDALNQLEEESQNLIWLPRYFPSNVRTIVSTTTENKYRIEGRGWPEFVITSLNDIQRKNIINSYLGKYTKKLSEKQQRMILHNRNSYNPLFLRTVLEELRVHGEFETLDEKMEYYMASETLEKLFQKVLNRLEDNYGEEMVKEVMMLIWASREGLSEIELRDIAKFKHYELSHFILTLDYHLTRKQGLYNFFHSFLREAVKVRYLHDGGKEKKIRLKIAAYFDEQRRKDRKKTMLDRIARELPWQYDKAGELEKLKDCLADINIFRCIFAQNEYEIAGYWAKLRKTYNVVKVYNESTKEYESNEHDKIKLAYSLNLIGLFLELMSEFNEAESFYIKALNIREISLGKEHPETASILNNLAMLYYEMGKYNKALPLLKRTLCIREKSLGEEHSKTAAALNNFALIYIVKGDFSKAETYLTRALEICKKVVGTEHADTARVIGTLGMFSRLKGNYSNSISYYTRALDIRSRV